MSTTPWAADTPALLAAGPLTHLSEAVVVHTDGTRTGVDIVQGTLSFDETRAPRVELTLTTHLIPPPAPTVEPRANTRVELAVGYLRPDGTQDVHQDADLGLRGRRRSRPADELELVATGDELLVIDAAPAAGFALSSTSTADAINDTIHQVLPTASITTTVTPAGPAVTMNQPDSDRWDVITDLADRLEAAVYDDGLRQWWITNRPNTLTTPALTLADGSAGTLVEVVDDTDRDNGWANYVYLMYLWRDAADVDHRVIATALGTGPWAPVPGNYKILRMVRDVPTTQTIADTVAATLVKRTITRGTSLNVTAPSTYWLRPGDTLALAEAGREEVRQLVTAVSFDLRSGLMNITTRQPD